MKVKELIQKLQQYDSECPIVYEDDHGYDSDFRISLRFNKDRQSCLVIRSDVEERQEMMDSYKK